MSDIGAKRKRNRFKVECLKCGIIHNGMSVNIKDVGAPENPFQSAAKASKITGKQESNHETCLSQTVEKDLSQEDSIQSPPILSGIEEVDIQHDEVNWLSCVGQLENIVTDLNECGTILSKLKSEAVISC
ncbi:uncharacterized protein LOC105844105 [Hydra vulgaris]|uniref:uncharacterized protein LOC105844105 n=1 Tax=Hydra vulgaris TaxID=6087 RepID=UPI0006416588|nr:uncharacterized protein LOC105844105 [Hydra vulgaris]